MNRFEGDDVTVGGWVEGHVVECKLWDQGLATLKLDAPVQPFEAGQFFQLGLDIGGERVKRSYSAASAPGAPLEFYLTNVPGGALTPQLFKLRPGDRVWVDSTPQGFFTLRYVPKSTCLWFVATGTGLGPFISMLRSPATWEHSERFVVVHGVRTRSQLAYREELEELESRRPLRYVPVVSRDLVRGGSELSGRITGSLDSGQLEAAAEQKLLTEGHHLLLCGNPAMIQEMMGLLEIRGLRRHRQRKPGHVTFEKYW